MRISYAPTSTLNRSLIRHMCAFTEYLSQLFRRPLRDDASPSGEVHSTGRGRAIDRLILLAHPFLISAWPLLRLYAKNVAELESSVALIALAIALAATAVLLLLVRIVLPSVLRAAFLVTAFSGMFFYYGRLFDRLSVHRKIIRTPEAWHVVLAAISIALLAATCFYLRRTKRDLRPLARFLTGTLAILVALAGWQIASAIWQAPATAVRSEPPPQSVLVAQRESEAVYPRVPPLEEDSPDRPDIYYIILDAYCRQDVLQNVYNYDNSEFLDFLRSRGFFVADKSCANYPYTTLSLPSSLNMRYLDAEIDGYNASADHGPSAFKAPFLPLLSKPLVASILQSKGYRFIYFRSNMWMTQASDTADMMVSCYPQWLQDEFAQAIMHATPLRIKKASFAQVHLYSFQKLKEIPEIRGPKFTFAHLVIPHMPFVFDREGHIVEDAGSSMTKNCSNDVYRQQYLDQLIYLNTRMREVIDAILKRSRSQPIIIVQSDHGFDSLMGNGPTEPPVDWDLFARERLPILNAYLVPEKMRAKLYGSITPVNSFRLLLTECFGEKFDLLPEVNYIGWYYERFVLRDATQLVTAKGAPSPDAVKYIDDLVAQGKTGDTLRR